jgi:hypothetical protein
LVSSINAALELYSPHRARPRCATSTFRTRTRSPLVAVKREKLVRLGRFDVLKKRLLAKLAVPTFDRVAIVHAVVTSEINAPAWVDMVAANLALNGRASSSSTRSPAAMRRSAASSRRLQRDCQSHHS